MSEDDFDMEEEIKARIPKNFNPQKYNIKFYFDVLNLIYNVNGEIILTSLTDNPQYLIINALTSKYEIKSMNILKFDKIMDDWKVIQTYYLESLPNPKDNIEECIYFPLENIIVDDLLKIEFEVEGEVELLNLTGLAVNFNEPKIQSLKKNKLSNIWENKIKEWPKEKIKENPIIESLVLSVVSEPNFIRLIFPCFDEPCYKSVFSFQLILDKYYMDAFPKLKCVTNGSLIKVEPIENNSKYLFTYKDTPLMSIYLFTFVVGNYDMIETVNENNIKIRVFTPLKNHHDGALAMNMIQNGIKFYHNFFNIKYYYDKIDLVPIPDMSFRAVENLGCIVFINYAMLFGHFQSILEKKLISRTCCHELSHMWFGNLVTMEWWNDIWLNEGFARLFEYLCLNSFENEKMKYWDNYIELIYESALTSDERISTHPINVEVPSARNIEEIFDNISYAKGSSVIRMLYYYLGEDLFKKSIRLYMEENKFKNTTTEILWKCFNNVTQLDILTLMNEWVNIPSHPILSIEINKNNINIKQTAYNNSDLLWKIPLFVKCSTKEQIILMSDIPLNENIFKFSKNKVKNNLLSNSYIENVVIKTDVFSKKVILEVEEREATFMLEVGNSYAFINNQGYILEITEAKLDVPVLQGYKTEIENIKPGNRLNEEDLKRLGVVLKILEVASNNGIGSLITAVNINNMNGFDVILETEDKIVHLGDCSDLSNKMLYVKEMLQREQGIEGEFFLNMDLNKGKPFFREKV